LLHQLAFFHVTNFAFQTQFINIPHLFCTKQTFSSPLFLL
jgi:hypothetical protein